MDSLLVSVSYWFTFSLIRLKLISFSLIARSVFHKSQITIPNSSIARSQEPEGIYIETHQQIQPIFLIVIFRESLPPIFISFLAKDSSSRQIYLTVNLYSTNILNNLASPVLEVFGVLEIRMDFLICGMDFYLYVRFRFFHSSGLMVCNHSRPQSLWTRESGTQTLSRK